MNTVRIFAFSVISAGLVGSAAVGSTGTAAANTGSDVRPPHVVATPQIRATPVPQIVPDGRWHRRVYQQWTLAPAPTD